MLLDRFKPLDFWHACVMLDEQRLAALLKQDASLASLPDENRWLPLHYVAASALFDADPMAQKRQMRAAHPLAYSLDPTLYQTTSYTRPRFSQDDDTGALSTASDACDPHRPWTASGGLMSMNWCRCWVSCLRACTKSPFERAATVRERSSQAAGTPKTAS